MDLAAIDPNNLSSLSDEEFTAIANQLLQRQALDRQQNALRYYQPVSDKARQIHTCIKKTIGVGGGNGSSKTESCLVEMVIRATGQVPLSLRDDYPMHKLRGPIACRLVCESLTTTLAPIILPKLQWWRWSGVDNAGGEKGHWGWIPKHCLIKEDWSKSWSEKTRMLRLLYRDPHNPDRVVGESTIQFMCLRGDQRVLLPDGTWRPVTDLTVGDEVQSPHGPSLVTKTYHYPIAPLFRVRTTGGREVVATANHQHYLANGQLLRTDQLNVGDILETFDCTSLHDSPPDNAMPLWALGWLGVMLGDGCLRREDAGFTATPNNRVLQDLPPLPPDTYLKQVADSEYRIWLKPPQRKNNPLVQLLKAEKLWGLKSAEKFVPQRVFRQGPAERAYFLRHIWNCDGTVNECGRQAVYTTISRTLAYDIKQLLWSIGIPASLGDYYGTCGFTGRMVHSYRVRVSGGAFNRFIAALQGDENFNEQPVNLKIKPGKILSIEPAGEHPVYCLEVDNPSHSFVVDGLVTHNSYDQDPSDFASGDFHFILHDEPPKLAIWQENRARVMRVDGTLMVAMTWPDDPSIQVDWIFDELYEKAQPGVDQDPHIAWFDLYTTDNPNLRQDAVAERASQMGEGERAARIYGQPIRLSNRVHPLFTDTQHWWCFECKKPIIRTDAFKCNSCGGDDIEAYCHVGDEVVEPNHPVIYCLDPHPRKPHVMAWHQVDPNDDLHVVMELEVALAPQELAEYVLELERERGWKTIRRLIDPNMGRSPSGTDRETTWQDAFDKAGLVCDLADDSDVGRAQLNVYLRPDPDTRRPRIHWDRSCGKAIYQMKRFLWDDFKKGAEKDQKQITKKKNDDFPACHRYAMNSNPDFRSLRMAANPMVSHHKAQRGTNGY